MATILDASLIGELLCEADATAGQITITTNNVTPNRDFSIRIVASNSREYAEKTDEICKLAFFKLLILSYLPCSINTPFVSNFLVCIYI